MRAGGGKQSDKKVEVRGDHDYGWKNHGDVLRWWCNNGCCHIHLLEYYCIGIINFLSFNHLFFHTTLFNFDVKCVPSLDECPITYYVCATKVNVAVVCYFSVIFFSSILTFQHFMFVPNPPVTCLPHTPLSSKVISYPVLLGTYMLWQSAIRFIHSLENFQIQ